MICIVALKTQGWNIRASICHSASAEGFLACVSTGRLHNAPASECGSLRRIAGRRGSRRGHDQSLWPPGPASRVLRGGPETGARAGRCRGEKAGAAVRLMNRLVFQTETKNGRARFVLQHDDAKASRGDFGFCGHGGAGLVSDEAKKAAAHAPVSSRGRAAGGGLARRTGLRPQAMAPDMKVAARPDRAGHQSTGRCA